MTWPNLTQQKKLPKEHSSTYFLEHSQMPFAKHWLTKQYWVLVLPEVARFIILFATLAPPTLFVFFVSLTEPSGGGQAQQINLLIATLLLFPITCGLVTQVL